MSSKEEVVLIVLNYNDSDATIKLVKAVHCYSCIDKIIIVDNLSTDDSLEKLRELLVIKKVDVIQTTYNGGYASGNNFGIKYAIKKYKVSYVIVSNPDVEFEEEAVIAMKRALAADKRIGAAAPRMLDPSGKKVKTAWVLPEYWACVRECFIVSNLIYDRWLQEYWGSSRKSPLNSIVLQGSLFMMSVAAFESIGGMDEGTFLYYEENILSRRLCYKGYKEMLIDDFSYIHRHSESIDKSIKDERTKFKILQKSREYYCMQYLGTRFAGIVLLRLSFHIGLLNFMICRKAQNVLKSISVSA